MKNKKTKRELSMSCQFSLVVFLLKKACGFCSVYIPMQSLYALFKALAPIMVSILPAMIIDALIARNDLMRILILALFAVMSGFAVNLFGYIIQRTLDRLAYVIDQNIEKSLDDAYIQMAYEKLEDPKLKDTSETARNVTNHASSLSCMITMLFNMLGQAVSLFGLAVILIRLVLTDSATGRIDGVAGWLAQNGGICLGFILALCVLSAYSSRLLAKVYRRFEKLFAPVGRAYRYYGDLARQETYAKDVRIFGLYKLIQQKIEAYRGDDRRVQLRLSRYEVGIGILGDVLMSMEIVLVYAVVSCKALMGMITIGEFYLYVSAVTQVITIVKGMISLANSIDRCLIYQKAYREILEQTRGNADNSSRQYLPDNDMAEIRFERVSFTYPGGVEPVLQDISFSLKKGERLALVGPNGAGKTTIIKLMLGLYVPQSGRILWNGQDIRNFSQQSYIRAFSAVFQDYLLIATSLKDNVTMELSTTPMEDRLWKSLERVNLTEMVGHLHKNVNTQLLQRFDVEGVNLSGGEAQKVAIARALYKEPAVLILDEPTAALDPISEREIFRLLQEKTIGQTAVFISHRLSSCRLCDRILVISDGHIIQEGSHEALDAQEGLYHMMWRAQADYYSV